MSARLCAISTTPTTGYGQELIRLCRYHDLSATYRLSGEQKLMLALLVDALNVYQRGALSPVGSVRRLYVDAERWIMQGRAHPEALSFETVCEALGINPTLLRRRVLEWKHEARARSMAANARLTVMPRQYHSNHRRGRPRLSQSA